MGSVSLKHVAGGIVVIAALFAQHLMPTRGPQPLRHDHTLDWSYIKVPHTDATPFERRLGEIASLVAGRPVQVRCEDVSLGTPEEVGGVVQWHDGKPADYARIRPDFCTALLKFVRDPARASFLSAQGLDVLAHESFHLRGVAQEHVAECYSMQEVPRVAHALGASDAEGRVLARVVYAYSYPHMPPEYHSRDCRPSGALDLHPGGGWPD
jgi:hypothetical protein